MAREVFIPIRTDEDEENIRDLMEMTGSATEEQLGRRCFDLMRVAVEAIRQGHTVGAILPDLTTFYGFEQKSLAHAEKLVAQSEPKRSLRRELGFGPGHGHAARKPSIN